MGMDVFHRKASLSARVSAVALAELQRMAAKEERSVSFLVDKAISEFVVRRSKSRADRPTAWKRPRRRGGE